MSDKIKNKQEAPASDSKRIVRHNFSVEERMKSRTSVEHLFACVDVLEQHIKKLPDGNQKKTMLAIIEQIFSWETELVDIREV